MPRIARAVTTPSRKASPKLLAELPEFVPPQLATLVDRPPTKEGWAHEIKLDGYRMQLRVKGGEAQLRTRKGLDWAPRFATLARAARVLPDCIIDGEVVVLNEHNIPSFDALQAACRMGTVRN